MLTRLRSTWLAGGGAVLLMLSVSGIAAGAAFVADTAQTVLPAEPLEGETDTTLTFEDIDGNGVDDDCQDVAAVEDADAAQAAMVAADLDADGTISVSEAAQSDWVGGKNCNHGGYVSTVAHDACDEGDEGDEPEIVPVVAVEETCAEEAEEAEETEDETDEPAPAECEAPVVAPVVAPVAEEDTPVDTAPNAHGKLVSEVAQSDAVGGKNCNHGGAVSEAAKKDHGDARANAAKKAHEKGHGKGHGKGPKH